MAEKQVDLRQVRNPDVRHDRSEVSVGGVVWFGVGMFIAAIVIHVGLWFLMEYFARREVAEKMPASPLRFDAPPEQLPPEPRLEGLLPPAEKAEPFVLPPDRLTGYEWVDRERGVVRIPIDQAMRLLVELPARQEEPEPEILVGPSSSNSGRTLTREEVLE